MVEININCSWNPQLHTLLIIFTLPPQTPFLLYKWGFEAVSFTRNCFHDDLQAHYQILHVQWITFFYTCIFWSTCSCTPTHPPSPAHHCPLSNLKSTELLLLLYWFFWALKTQFEPAHEIMVLFNLHKLILQKCMRSHPVGLDVWFLVRPFVYFHTSCVRTAKAVARVCRCAGSSEPSLVAYVISTIISWAGSFRQFRIQSASLTQYLMVKPQVFKF